MLLWICMVIDQMCIWYGSSRLIKVDHGRSGRGQSGSGPEWFVHLRRRLGHRDDRGHSYVNAYSTI